MEKLMQRAQKRQLENDIVFERNQLRERKKEDHLYHDKDKYATAGFLKKQQERKLFHQ